MCGRSLQRGQWGIALCHSYHCCQRINFGCAQPDAAAVQILNKEPPMLAKQPVA